MQYWCYEQSAMEAKISVWLILLVRPGQQLQRWFFLKLILLEI